MGDTYELRYSVARIFRSYMGEGIEIGKPATFVRFAGCNLHCSWCDTDWLNPVSMLIEDIISTLERHRNRTIVITGGEPLIQRNIWYLVGKLISLGFSVHIETNGTQEAHAGKVMIKETLEQLFITVSPKPETGWEIHDECFPNELKFVIDEHIDMGNIENCLYSITRRQGPIEYPVWLMPQDNWDESISKTVKFAHYFSKRRSNVRLGIQAHKVWRLL